MVFSTNSTITDDHNKHPGRRFLDSKEFVHLRKKLNKTQAQMAQLLGTSVKAIHSYEQGWRRVPAHAERQLFFLVASKGDSGRQKPCWVTRKYPPEQKKQCPAWEFRAGKFCWFINGTICDGVVQRDWHEKMKMCRSCEVFSSIF